MTGRLLFVYGTLRRGGANDITRMRPAPRPLGVATIAGRLYDLGAYPGLMLDRAGGSVRGELYRIEPALERQLDRLEGVSDPPQPGDEYFKRSIPVHPVQMEGRALDCVVYEINPERIVAAPLIAGGDWLARPRDR